jgi:arylsulfatase A
MARLLSLLAFLVAPAVPAAERPNVVVLLADDMGYGDLGVQNPDSKVPTPHLDALAKGGIRFTDAHSSSGVCTPSRYALRHGRYHWRKFHGIVNSFDQTVLDSDRTTLAQLLKAKGYRTGCVGKWHLGWDWKAIQKPGTKPGTQGYAPADFDWAKKLPGGPLDFGFDHYFGDDVPNFPPYAWFEDDRIRTVPTVPLVTTPKPAEGNWEARPGPSVKDWDFTAVMPKLTEKAVEWIGKQQADEPFFLYFPFTSPHAPIVPNKEFTGSTKCGGYGDYMAQTDAAVGAVLAALEKRGFDKNTLVIFTSDNGPERYAYERVKAHGHRSMGPLRGLKRDLWEGGHRVPFVVRWPGQVPAGAVSDALVSHIDLYATVAAIVGADLPPRSGEDSVNQLELFLGKGAGKRDTLVHNTNADGYAVRHGDWVLIDVKTGGVSAVPKWYDEQQGYKPHTQPGELYNLKDDLAQKDNRYADQPDRVAELRKRLAKIRRPVR